MVDVKVCELTGKQTQLYSVFIVPVVTDTTVRSVYKLSQIMYTNKKTPKVEIIAPIEEILFQK